jgi:hypothetical protein
MSDDKPRRLGLNDPVPPPILAQFEELAQARTRFSNSLMNLEQEKIRILAATRRIDDQRDRLFEQVLVERGLAPNTPVEIDRAGKIHLTESSQQAPAPPPEPPVEEPAG